MTEDRFQFDNHVIWYCIADDVNVRMTCTLKSAEHLTLKVSCVLSCNTKTKVYALTMSSLQLILMFLNLTSLFPIPYSSP